MSVLSRLFDRGRPPAEALRPLGRDERVVSWATTTDGATVVATPRGLWLPGSAGPERLAWHLVDKATWRGGTLTLIAAVDTGDGVLHEQPPRSVRLAQPRDLPSTVRARVERSIAFTRHHRLRPAGGVRVVGRRVPGRDGLSWQLVFDPGTDQDGPLRMQAVGLLDLARTEFDGPGGPLGPDRVVGPEGVAGPGRTGPDRASGWGSDRAAGAAG